MNGELIDHLLDLSGTQPVFVLSYLNPGARSSAFFVVSSIRYVLFPSWIA